MKYEVHILRAAEKEMDRLRCWSPPKGVPVMGMTRSLAERVKEYL